MKKLLVRFHIFKDKSYKNPLQPQDLSIIETSLFEKDSIDLIEQLDKMKKQDQRRE